ncbi:hypothetical protein B296_00041553 [Ensete ventricosum]|uniref:Uncharacterized protein n=1 Tax=Ensete ventricosum TaxID=4639 RepID=A0A426XK84_ENSVE|nr:hypothetical protein B296_00041553 [Ensete ventricosum]
MGRSPCCDEIHVKKGPWTPEEDKKLVEYIQLHGHRRSWRELPKNAGLNRCGKSCRLRWTNYLRPDIKRGKLSEEEEGLIVQLHSALGNKWSKISTHLPGRTDNEIKNYWNTHLRKKLLRVGIDPVTHQRTTDLDLLSRLPNLLAATAKLGNLDNALRLHADAVARYQMLKGLITLMTPSVLPPNTDALNRLGLLASPGRYDLLQQNDQLEGLVNGSLAFGRMWHKCFNPFHVGSKLLKLHSTAPLGGGCNEGLPKFILRWSLKLMSGDMLFFSLSILESRVGLRIPTVPCLKITYYTPCGRCLPSKISSGALCFGHTRGDYGSAGSEEEANIRTASLPAATGVPAEQQTLLTRNNDT